MSSLLIKIITRSHCSRTWISKELKALGKAVREIIKVVLLFLGLCAQRKYT